MGRTKAVYKRQMEIIVFQIMPSQLSWNMRNLCSFLNLSRFFLGMRGSLESKKLFGVDNIILIE
jgi:hypothetical protein